MVGKNATEINVRQINETFVMGTNMPDNITPACIEFAITTPTSKIPLQLVPSHDIRWIEAAKQEISPRVDAEYFPHSFVRYPDDATHATELSHKLPPLLHNPSSAFLRALDRRKPISSFGKSLSNPFSQPSSKSSDLQEGMKSIQERKGLPPAYITTSLNNSSVIFGRGSPSVQHKGNIRFRQLVQKYKARYRVAKKRYQKEMIAREVVMAVKQRGGRFLRRIESIVEAESLGVVPGVTAWMEVDDALAIDKAKQSLRDRQTDSSDCKTSKVLEPNENGLLYSSCDGEITQSELEERKMADHEEPLGHQQPHLLGDESPTKQESIDLKKYLPPPTFNGSDDSEGFGGSTSAVGNATTELSSNSRNFVALSSSNHHFASHDMLDHGAALLDEERRRTKVFLPRIATGIPVKPREALPNDGKAQFLNDFLKRRSSSTNSSLRCWNNLPPILTMNLHTYPLGHDLQVGNNLQQAEELSNEGVMLLRDKLQQEYKQLIMANILESPVVASHPAEHFATSVHGVIHSHITKTANRGLAGGSKANLVGELISSVGVQRSSLQFAEQLRKLSNVYDSSSRPSETSFSVPPQGPK